MTTTKSLNGFVRELRGIALPTAAPGPTDGQLLAEYVACRSETAFAALVQRHGPMVLGVCRRILRNNADAEDAFQATFLVLVRKANSLRSKNLVSNWLYGVAHNTALKARAMIHKRQAREREAGTVSRQSVPAEVWEQVQAMLDREITALPDKYRLAIVLCDLEGKTIKEAAGCLGWPQGTVATRLARGRALLGRRLSQHGLSLSAAGLAATLAGGRASAGMPTQLVSATLRAGEALAAGRPLDCLISTKVAALTEGVVKEMLLSKLKYFVLLFAGLGLFLSTAALLANAVWPVPPTQAPERGTSDKSSGGVAQPGAKPMPKPDITVQMKAQFYEVDDAFYQRLVKAKRLSRNDLDALEDAALAPVVPADVEPLFKLLEKQKPGTAGREIDAGTGRDSVLLSWRKPIECLPSVDEARKGGKRPQVVAEGVEIHTVAHISADRRYVRVKFTEKSTELEGTERVKVPVDNTPDTAAAEIVFLRESEQSRVRDLPDGGTFLLPIQYRPHDAREKNRWLVLRVHARIIIEEEEREFRKQQGGKPP